MPWFRFKRKKDERQTAPEGATHEVPADRVTTTPAEPEIAQDATSTDPAAAVDGDAAARNKRRRGSRGGRGRKRAGDGAESATATAEAERD